MLNRSHLHEIIENFHYTCILYDIYTTITILITIILY